MTSQKQSAERRLNAAEAEYTSTCGYGGNFAEVVAAAQEYAAAFGIRPSACQHHQSYPGDGDFCRGEPSQYCHTAVDRARRAARLRREEERLAAS